ncbi:MAG TPA: DNA-binding domain-containing protein [Candidatus Angelobacter sp.]|nr:DNA-binding domain-containing protein [Candidatus Angelobacter sp.]
MGGPPMSSVRNTGGPPVPRRQTIAELRELQRLAFATISFPLTKAGDPQRTFRDGRPMRDVAAGFIKPNDRLTSLERIAIYNRQYWYRLMDCLWDDYPGLRAILGKQKFEKLRIAYLTRYPSRSFTLRNLGDHLVQFLEEEPQYTAPNGDICLDMARFEWAQVVAFDGEERPPLAVDDLLGQDPAKLRLSLQPYLTLLEMDYPLDDFVIAVKKRDEAMRSQASNAMEAERIESNRRRSRIPRREKIFLAVHRHENDLYYKRLDPAEYQLLILLRDGKTLADACSRVISEYDDLDWTARIQRCFARWTETGWFCKRH